MFPFGEKIVSTFEFVRLYRNAELQHKALSKLPDSFHTNIGHYSDNLQIDLLKKLMTWFRTFFSWVDKPNCSKCGSSETVSRGHSSEKSELILTSNVEVYSCNDCAERVLFPRFNDPAILLNEPRGRCGEWANVFTLFCIAVGLDARYVLDSTDHVWTEVYSSAAERWVHCDPCEDAIDSPLMYEAGWKKKLSYIIAFSPDEVQDVTWRYTQFYDAALCRRTQCNEKDLISLIMRLNKQRENSKKPVEVQHLLRRRIKELVEFLTPPILTENYGGRLSGSLCWRIERNEYAPDFEEPNKNYIWTPDEIDLSRQYFTVKYSTALNKYIRRDADEVLHDWKDGTYKHKSVFRKVEFDWKMTYLCRNDKTESGSIDWKFDLLDLKETYRISFVKINYTSQTFHGGSVQWLITSDHDTTIKLNESKDYFETSELNNQSWFILTAKMSQGTGKDAWQHAQILRQQLNAKDYPLIITVQVSLK